jgi:hypothetical protein
VSFRSSKAAPATSPRMRAIPPATSVAPPLSEPRQPALMTLPGPPVRGDHRQEREPVDKSTSRTDRNAANTEHYG